MQLASTYMVLVMVHCAPQQEENVMSQTLTHVVKDGKLVITIDVSKKSLENAPMSTSGKNKLVASTHGFMVIGEGLSLSLNLTAKK